MIKKDTAALAERVTCKTCMKEVPISEANSAEASDYVAYFCGLNCYDKWRTQPGALPSQDDLFTETPL